ncbi:hypothetical protein [Geobacter sp. AOG1]|uniref:hypothetical protein n=1 Tax=Geobacter sp. AOG1 TaxID=1566346 RepID=UPI001CC67733|nr:hypothetical protein [Geobacter sp. AOG1]GFE57112.1 hypothetical protein AOG1_09910 [Geobacter sp. AOG1]
MRREIRNEFEIKNQEFRGTLYVILQEKGPGYFENKLLGPFIILVVLQKIPAYSVRLVTSSRWKPNWV